MFGCRRMTGSSCRSRTGRNSPGGYPETRSTWAEPNRQAAPPNHNLSATPSPPGVSTMTRSTSRRDVLLGAAALAGTASLPRAASAQAKGRIVVGTWGGDYARLLNKNIEAQLLIKDGWEVVQDQAGDPERRSQVLAERRVPRRTP